MIAPLRELHCEPRSAGPQLSSAARQAAARLLPPSSNDEPAPAVPAWQAWLLVAWLVATSVAYVCITLGVWTG